MPVISRSSLRQDLGQNYVRDMYVGTTKISVPTTNFMVVMDSMLADPTFSGTDIYQRSFLRVGGIDYRVGSLNTGSGALQTLFNAQTVVNINDVFEVSTRLSSGDKDRAINETLKRIRLKREITLNCQDNLQFYDLSSLGSPNYVTNILDVHYFADPTNSLNRNMNPINDWAVVTTGSGTRELRINPALKFGQQLVVEAILTPTLGASDASTVDIPDEHWVLSGAAAYAYHMMIQGAPGQQVTEYKDRRKEWADEFSRMSTRQAPLVSESIRMHTPDNPSSGGSWAAWTGW